MTTTIFFYVAINLMMVMGLAPVVGIPLPFMSHGGSSMMTNMICIGTLMVIDRWSQRAARLRGSPRKAAGTALSSVASNRYMGALPRDSRAAARSSGRYGRIAQLVEQLTLNQRVLGSSPSASTTFQSFRAQICFENSTISLPGNVWGNNLISAAAWPNNGG